MAYRQPPTRIATNFTIALITLVAFIAGAATVSLFNPIAMQKGSSPPDREQKHQRTASATSEKPQHPPVTSNEDFHGERSHYTFSQDKQHLAFVQNVFDEYGADWDRYWALHIINLTSKQQKTAFIGDYKMSAFEWLNNDTIRVYQSAETGVRTYHDISTTQLETLIYKNVKNHPDQTFWLLDEEFIQKTINHQQAHLKYLELTKPADTEELLRQKSSFTLSPNKRHIAYTENVFAEYGQDYDKYWAVRLISTDTGEEKTLFIDSVKMSSYEWLNNDTIRVYHNGGTGVRIYRDVSIFQSQPLVWKDYKYQEDPSSFWQIDEEYVQRAIDVQRAYQKYVELSASPSE